MPDIQADNWTEFFTAMTIGVIAFVLGRVWERR
jgi:hypothetical protein